MSAAHQIGQSLSDMLGWPDAPWGQVEVSGTPTGLATEKPIADIAAAAHGMVGLAAAGLHEARGGRAQTVSVDRFHASLSMTSAEFLRVDGAQAVSWDPLTGYQKATDGWVYTHCQFAHLRDRLLAAFDLPNEPERVKAVFATMPAQQIEDSAQAAGACGVRLRSRSEWQTETHSAHLRTQPLIRFEQTGDATARDIGLGEAPLSGVRVLDLSRVIAGPMIGRTLAEYGAEVIRIASPNLPFLEPLVIDTGFGKRSAHVDLETAEGREVLAALIRDADVFVDGYRPGALAGKGFGLEALRALNPRLVYVTLSAFGETGPWGGRRGYDTYVQAATGLSGRPSRLPCQPLDYLTGYLGAASVMTALRRRMTEGGSWRIEMSLARNAEWVWDWTDALPAEPSPPGANPSPEDIAALMIEMGSGFGQLRALAPVPRLPVTPPTWSSAPVPIGSNTPAWR